MSISKKTILHLAGAILVLGLTSFFMFRALQQIDGETFWNGFHQVRLSSLLGGLLLMLSVIAWTAWLWKIFLPPGISVSFLTLCEIIATWATTINTLPFYGGHPLAIYLLVKKGKLTKTAALSVLSMDQLVEGVARLPVFAVVVLATPMPDWMRNGMLAVLAAVLVALIVCLGLAHTFRDPPMTKKQFRFSWFEKIYLFFSNWAHHLHFLRNWKKMAMGLMIAFAMKLCMVLPIYWVQRGFGLDLPLWTAFLIMSALFLTTMVPVTPGNLGVFEATVFFIYKMLGVDPSRALVLALFHHLVYLLPLVIPGYLYSLKDLVFRPSQIRAGLRLEEE